MQSDDALLDAWRAGDRDAGDELVLRHFDALCRFFRSKLGDDVEDLIQRTFLDLLESRDRIRSTTVRGWLFTVARHRLLDDLRARLRRPVDALPSCSIADLRTGVSGRLARAQDQDLVLEAMKHLPLDAQIALELSYWEELSGAEIAAVLDVSPHTVRSRLARARAQLRDRVQALAERPVEAAASLRRLDARLGRRPRA